VDNNHGVSLSGQNAIVQAGRKVKPQSLKWFGDYINYRFNPER